MLVFAEGGKPENPEKNPRSKARTNNKLNPHMAPGTHRSIERTHQARAALVGGERSRHCTIPAVLFVIYICSSELPVSGSERSLRSFR